MTYQTRYTREAYNDLVRLFRFLVEHDPDAACEAMAAIEKGFEMLKTFPFTCRKVAPDNAFLRELIIPFGSRGYVALFEIEDHNTVTILAVRHQRESDYH